MPAFGHFAPDLPAPLQTKVAPDDDWWFNASARLDPFINDAYGFRGVFLAADRAVRRATHSRRRPVLIGANGQMFYLGDRNLEKALGVVVDHEGLDQLFGVLDDLHARAEKIGAKLVVTSPPAGETVNFDLLPEWARIQKVEPTEYDLLKQRMQDQGIIFVDLRQPLIDARAGGPDYRRTDTHWNFRGSLIGLNEVLKGAGLGDLAVTEQEELGPIHPEGSGDLTRLNGQPQTMDDQNYTAVNFDTWSTSLKPIEGIFATPDKDELFIPYAYETGHPGPRVLIYGDSFTQGYWPPFLYDRVSALAWTHHKFCGADLTAVERFKPDIIIYAVTQRSLACRKPTQL